jgi:hypothetical protein
MGIELLRQSRVENHLPPTVEVTTFGLFDELVAKFRLELDDPVTCLAARAAGLDTDRLATPIKLVGARMAE